MNNPVKYIAICPHLIDSLKCWNIPTVGYLFPDVNNNLVFFSTGSETIRVVPQNNSVVPYTKITAILFGVKDE